MDFSCQHFGSCGGCSQLDLNYEQQVSNKQEVFRSILKGVGGVIPQTWLEPLQAQAQHYRHRARLSVSLKDKKVALGFRSQKGGRIIDMKECQVLPPLLVQILPALRQAVADLSMPAQILQFELSVVTAGIVLLIRHRGPLSADDQQILVEFSKQHECAIYLQAREKDPVVFLEGFHIPLEYQLEEYVLTLCFEPQQFTQINPWINQLMVRQAMDLLAPESGDKIGDLFCGIGNFSLPMARLGAQVTGIEFSESQVNRAAANAQLNDLATQSHFVVQDLSRASQALGAQLAEYNKLLLDPPRSGAEAVVVSLNADGPQRIVYVSCNPKTLARDAKQLIEAKGYQLTAAGLIDMFPHTEHMEAIACFEKE